MRTLRFAFVVLYFSLAQLQAQESRGIIVGTVLNEQGEPIAQAQVCIGRTEVKDAHSQTIHTNCPTKTDDLGQFRVENLAAGTVIVSASKHQDGYCEYGRGPNLSETTVTLSAASPLAKVVLRFGHKGGMVAPIVADAFTGQPIFNFMVSAEVHDSEDPGFRESVSGGFSKWTTSLCVPSNTDLALQVRAKGYKAVSYPSPTQPSLPATIRLSSGETVSFQVSLSPDENIAQKAH
jgi:hypothetical protein